MDDFDYSLDALDVLSLFHDCDSILYVEGEDDICFWNSILKIADIKGYYIESVNGSKNLIPLMDKIISDGSKILVAKDKDDTLLDDGCDKHVQIVTTYGHSIENHLYCPVIINNIINSFIRSEVDLSEVINTWYSDLCEVCNGLIVFNIANNIFKKGVSIFGDNCCRFLTTKRSCKLSKANIDIFIYGIKESFFEHEITKSNDLIEMYDGNKRYLINGHFITNAIINFIKSMVRRLTNKSITLPIDNLYALTINGCSMCKNRCKEILEIVEYMKLANLAIIAT